MQARDFRLYSQEVVELAHGVSLLLLLPPADSVCSAPGQSNLYTPLSGFLHLPLQMFEMGNTHMHAFRPTSRFPILTTTSISPSPPPVHFYTYKEKFISLYCRLSSVLELDALITQQALREAISDDEVATAKQKHQLIVDFIQVRYITKSGCLRICLQLFFFIHLRMAANFWPGTCTTALCLSA